MQKKFKIVFKTLDKKAENFYKKIDELSAYKVKLVKEIQEKCTHQKVISAARHPDTYYLCLICGKVDYFSKAEGYKLFFNTKPRHLSLQRYLKISTKMFELTDHFL